MSLSDHVKITLESKALTVSQLMDKLRDRLAAATSLPRTVLFGIGMHVPRELVEMHYEAEQRELRARMRLIDHSRSVARAVLLGSEPESPEDIARREVLRAYQAGYETHGPVEGLPVWTTRPDTRVRESHMECRREPGVVKFKRGAIAYLDGV